ncbi:uncharacterized protein LOC110019602 [Phalaenopsis equestris]|uniref:uncharacterized protein LOC110019602 n=1 Tax=Phalaenopsis equestris TaxID=78828 RepID=UPI0009E4F006|nr:uncharacterized protein LOC110019602 [Phalaenopsis equestris]
MALNLTNDYSPTITLSLRSCRRSHLLSIDASLLFARASRSDRSSSADQIDAPLYVPLQIGSTLARVPRSPIEFITRAAEPSRSLANNEMKFTEYETQDGEGAVEMTALRESITDVIYGNKSNESFFCFYRNMTSRISITDIYILCYCGLPAQLLTSRQSHSFGRRFYSCAKGVSARCDFFQWADNPSYYIASNHKNPIFSQVVRFGETEEELSAKEQRKAGSSLSEGADLAKEEDYRDS